MNQTYDIVVKKKTFITIICEVKTETIDYSTVPETRTTTTKNLSGYTAKLMIKENIDDDDSKKLLEKTGVIDAPASGIVTFLLTRNDNDISAGKYYYEVVVFSGAGATDYQVVMNGRYIVEEIVKKSIT